MIDKKPGKQINTDSIQEQVDTDSAAPNESHTKIVAEDRVPQRNASETTTIELIETDSQKVYFTSNVNNIEPSVTKELAMVKKDNPTEETIIKPKEKEENETFTVKVNVESGPDLLTYKADEYSAAKEVVATSFV